MKKTFRLVHATARLKAQEAVIEAPEGYSVTLAPPARNLEQNAKFHSICSDIERSGLMWAGKARTAAQWKVLLVSGHATATKEGSEVITGLEGELINIRESTALMSKKRGSSLIEYALAYCALNEVRMDHESAFASY